MEKQTNKQKQTQVQGRCYQIVSMAGMSPCQSDSSPTPGRHIIFWAQLNDRNLEMKKERSIVFWDPAHPTFLPGMLSIAGIFLVQPSSQEGYKLRREACRSLAVQRVCHSLMKCAGCGVSMQLIALVEFHFISLSIRVFFFFFFQWECLNGQLLFSITWHFCGFISF